MLDATLAEAGIFKKLSESVKELVTEANFDCDEYGITIQAMDASHVSLVSVKLAASDFLHYKCDPACTIGININTLNKMLKCVNNDDSLRIVLANTDVVKFMFANREKDRKFNFNLNLMDIHAERFDIPEFDATGSVFMSSNEYTRICKDMLAIGDTVKISTSSLPAKQISFDIVGESGSGNMILEECTREEEQVKIEVTKDFSHDFALKYMNHFAKGGLLSNKIRLILIENSPIVVEFQISQNSWLKFYLAPKIED